MGEPLPAGGHRQRRDTTDHTTDTHQSAASRLHLGCTSAAPRVVSRLHFGCTRVLPPLCYFLGPPLGRVEGLGMNAAELAANPVRCPRTTPATGEETGEPRQTRERWREICERGSGGARCLPRNRTGADGVQGARSQPQPGAATCRRLPVRRAGAFPEPSSRSVVRRCRTPTPPSTRSPAPSRSTTWSSPLRCRTGCPAAHAHVHHPLLH